MKTRFLAVLAAIILSPALVFADFTVTGTCQYRDREFNETGFTGVEPDLPIRFADVEIVDDNAGGNNAIRATGSTDASGAFTIPVSDNQVRNIVVRCLTQTENLSSYFLSVTDLKQNASVYGIVSSLISGHDPNSDISLGNLVAIPGQGGEAFNIFNVGLDALDYLEFLNGVPPGSTRPLVYKWEPNTGNPGSNFNLSNASIHVGDESAYDDTILLHETGHFAIFHWSGRDSPGGFHRLSNCDQDIRLAFDEGFASFFGNSVRRWKGYPRPEIYVNTNGMPGPGQLDFFFNLETEIPFTCDGSTSEVSVYTALWDIADGPATPDGTPGVDEPFDLLSLDDHEIWEVMTNYIPTALFISLEDFWDGWFSPGIANGFGGEMVSIFENLSIEFSEDLFEPNDPFSSAKPVTTSGFLFHNTYFADPDGDFIGSPDTDYFSFLGLTGVEYLIETLNLLSDSNTFLRLRDTDGVTLISENNDRTLGDPTSLISFIPTVTGTYFVESFHAADLGDYGSYDFRISAQGGQDQDGDGFDISVDCDDTDPNINPSATEVCNGIDDDCDSLIDNGFDLDADGVTTCAGDCDDFDTNNFPGNTEICDNKDNDCNTLIDEGFDQDGDGFTTCQLPTSDCDDFDPNINPGAVEICDSKDNNCDGLIDEGFDQDGDGFSTCDSPTPDCDDSNPAVNPGATEGPIGDASCSDSLDNDCDGSVDSLDPGCQASPPCPDADVDGYADCTSDPSCDSTGLTCGDCDDADPAVHPGAVEACDGIDNDCDFIVDNGCFSCDNDGVCESGEDCNSCSNDCSSSTGSTCGNGLCEAADGEDCNSCPVDCNSKTKGKPDKQFCCGAGGLCGNAACNKSPFSCSETSTSPSCCGDGVCGGAETCGTCGIDCNLGAEVCSGGIDEDCNGLIDCDDPACSSDAACQCVPTHEKEKGPRCSDNLDNDCDGLVDGADPDC